METLTYNLVIDAADEGGYIARVPALPGCHTQGDTLEETIAHAREAVEGFIETLARLGKEIPVESTPAAGFALGLNVRLPVRR